MLEKFGTFVIALVLAIPFSLLNSLAYGYTIVHFNRWFIIPTFGTPEFSYWTAAGLALLANMLGPHADLVTEVDGAECFKRIGRIASRPWLVLGLGAVIHFWFMA